MYRSKKRVPRSKKHARLLGSKFFSELQGSRQSAKTKVYDVNLSEQTEGDFGRQSDEHSTERAFSVLTEDVEPELDAEFMEVMLAAEDQDALLVSSFEQELEDFLQDVPDMHDAMVTYLEARSKLLGETSQPWLLAYQARRKRQPWPWKRKRARQGKTAARPTFGSHCQVDLPSVQSKRPLESGMLQQGQKSWWWHRCGQHCWAVPAFHGPWSSLRAWVCPVRCRWCVLRCPACF